MSRTIRRLFLAASLAAAPALAAPGCTTTEEPRRVEPAPAEPAPESEGLKAERSGQKGIKLTSPDPEGTRADDEGPNAGDYAMVVPENAVYLPWKFIGGGIKGASDGVRAGFDKGRMPLLGLVFSPVNLVVGFLTGACEGSAMSPGVVGPSDYFGRAMSGPTKRATTIWWYP
jgi:hypothetical protein